MAGGTVHEDPAQNAERFYTVNFDTVDASGDLLPSPSTLNPLCKAGAGVIVVVEGVVTDSAGNSNALRFVGSFATPAPPAVPVCVATSYTPSSVGTLALGATPVTFRILPPPVLDPPQPDLFRIGVVLTGLRGGPPLKWSLGIRWRQAGP